jgi:hypothetical protein
MATVDLPTALTTPGSSADADSYPPWRQATLLGLVFAAIDLVIHITVNMRAQQVGYGLFRDELYYIVCGRRLAWGYLDNQPLIAVLARLTDTFFGHDRLWTFRLLPSLAGAAKVLLTGLLARSLGGRRAAQALAMIAVIGAPEYLAVDTILSMNCLEPVFWMTAMLAMLELAKHPAARVRIAWWLTFGVAGGLALETKLSGGFFLICLLAGLLMTRERRILFDRWAAAGVGLVLLTELPNFLWQLHRGFPTLQWLEAVSHEGKDVVLGPLEFLWQQALVLNPFSVVFWVAGALWLIFGGQKVFRFAGATALLFIALMMALHAKTYYVIPIYPLLFAAGSVFCYRQLARKKWLAFPLAYMSLFAAAAWYWMPIVLPIAPPSRFAYWEQRLHYRPLETENFREVALPQFLADMTSWPSFVEQVAAAYNRLPPEVRAGTGIFCSNYGEASALDVYGAVYGLPPAISGHQNYWYWGPRGELRDTIVDVGDRRKDVEQSYRQVDALGVVHAPYAMPYENGATIWFAEGLLRSPEDIWQSSKEWY